MDNMSELKRELKKLSRQFKVRSERNGFSLWYGKDHRLLIWERGELSVSDVIRLAKDYLKRHPESV